ncbi:hypothetical protein D3C85_1753590 [compost metagenome]
MLGAKFLRNPGEKVLAGRSPLPVYLGDPCLHFDRQTQLIHFFEQGCVQFAAQQLGVGQGATVKNRVAFTAGRHQVGLGQYLEVVAHA